MIVYKDVLGYYKDELFSDAFPIEELPGLYAVSAKTVSVDKPAPVEDEGDDDQEPGPLVALQVINLVDAHRLQVAAFDKKSYLNYLKGYMKAVENYLATTAPDKVQAFKTQAQETAKAIVADFDSYTFYQGENADAEGMVAFARPTGDGIWTFNFWRHGAHAEKY